MCIVHCLKTSIKVCSSNFPNQNHLFHEKIESNDLWIQSIMKFSIYFRFCTITSQFWIVAWNKLLDYKSSLALPPFILEVYLQIRIKRFVPVENKKESRKKC